MKKITIEDSARKWVGEFNVVPQEILQKLSTLREGEVEEITPVSIHDRVMVYAYDEEGVVVEYAEHRDLLIVELDTGGATVVPREGLDAVQYDMLPMWGTMWAFGNSMDNEWLERDGNLQKMADCGFRIYTQEDYGYVFGIDGAGYDFYESHWIPLYKARGFQWHDSEVIKCG